MKKRILLFSLAAGMLYITTTGYQAGSAVGGAGNRTGAKGSVANCSSGGCHTGTTPPATPKIYVDSAGIPVNQYTAGKVYSIRVVGKHSVNTKFGFQFTAVSGTGAAQVNAGTFSALPTGLANHSASSLNIIEQTSAISAVSPADSFVKSFTWTAPATGVGPITMYLTVNAVDGNGSENSGDVSANISKTLPLYTPPTIVGCVANPGNGPIAFPNPAFNELNLQMDNPYSTHSVQVIDITGRTILNTQIQANATGLATLNTSAWATGLYKVVVADETSREVVSIVKQ